VPSRFVQAHPGNFTDIVCGEGGQVIALSGKRAWILNSWHNVSGVVEKTTEFTLMSGNWDQISIGRNHAVALSGGRMFGYGNRTLHQFDKFIPTGNPSTDIDWYYSFVGPLSGTHWVNAKCSGDTTYALRRQF
jgi:hypothetical protein